jgi:hypothetical protein
MTLACRGEILDQPLISEPPNNPPGRSGGSSPLVGVWVATDSTASVDSVVVTQAITTRWQFSSDNTCSFQRTTVFTPPGSIQTVSRACTYIDQGATVSVTYDDNTSEDLPYSVPTGTPNQLVLGGVTYDRSS